MLATLHVLFDWGGAELRVEISQFKPHSWIALHLYLMDGVLVYTLHKNYTFWGIITGDRAFSMGRKFVLIMIVDVSKSRWRLVAWSL